MRPRPIVPALVALAAAGPCGAAGCSRAPAGAPGTSTLASPAADTGVLEPWSRDAAAPPTSPARVAGETPGSSDPAALGEIVERAPRRRWPEALEAGAGRIGSPTGVPAADAGVAPPPAPEPAPPHAAAAHGSAEMSTPSIERECRAQLYWPLVQRCRDPSGSILPPEVVTLRFLVDADGAIVSSSIFAAASEPRWEPAAECMRRELSALPFRAPASVRGAVTRVEATVPSVD